MSEKGWLIERHNDTKTEYLIADGMGFEWTSDPLLSIRFSRREDAEQIAAILDDDADAIAEHEWVDADAERKLANDETAVERAFRVVKQLQDWSDDRDGLSLSHIAGVTCTEYSLDVFVGDVAVWSDNGDSIDELTFEYCRDAFLKHIASFRPFFSELPVERISGDPKLQSNQAERNESDD